MFATIPSVDVVRTELGRLSHAQLQRLAALSGVPFTTLWKIRDGTTKNPGIETVRQFLPHLDLLAEVHSAPAPLMGAASA